MSDDKVFLLDRVKLQWDEFVMRRKRMKEDKKWTDQFTKLLKELMGEAKVLQLGGNQVGSLVPGQLDQSLLNEEQPDIVKQYTRYVTEQKFDAVAFQAEQPKLYEQYRVQRLVQNDGGPALEGFIK